MLIRPVSDLHLEFQHNLKLDKLPEDQDTVLVVAGDLGTAHTRDLIYSWFRHHSPQFRHIIYVLGNHDYYGGKFKETLSDIKQDVCSIDNVSVLDREDITIGHVKFLCATLWTDMNKWNPNDMFTAKSIMSDYRLITVSVEPGEWRRLEPFDTIDDFIKSRLYLEDSLSIGDQKYVVVTHHLPSRRCISPEHELRSSLNCAYASDLDHLFLDDDYVHPVAWIHGHTHSSVNFLHGDTMVVCNPFGYYGSEVNPNFKQDLRIVV